MSEQQRVFVAVAASIVILLGWQYLMSMRAPQPVPQVTTTSTPTPSSEKTDEKKAPAVLDAGPDAAVDAVAGLAEGELVEGVEPVAEVMKIKPTSRELNTPELGVELANIHGAMTSVYLKSYNESPDEDKKVTPIQLATVLKKDETQLQQAWTEFSIDGKPGPELDFISSDHLLLEGKTADGITTQIEIKPGTKPYALDYTLSLTNLSARAVPVSAHFSMALYTEEEGGSMFAPANIIRGLCEVEGSVDGEQKNGLEDEPYETKMPSRLAGIDRQYFLIAALVREGEATCHMYAKDNALRVELRFAPETLGGGAVYKKKLELYAGPKRGQELSAVDHLLTEVVDYNFVGIPLGLLALPIIFLLNIFHGWTASWGIAILLLTLLVKSLLFPVTMKSSMSMRKMALLQPEIKKMQAKYEGDKERQQIEQMKLFKDKGVNPFGGCLPMLMQMPVWVALYRALWSSVDLYQQSFLWLIDLTAKEPFPLLALSIGALTFLQQRITPMTTDSQQAKMMMYLMPVMLTVFMLALPSGLVLYILFNSVLTIGQQMVINRRQITL